tara:strand:- start:957 stop:1151 length:195 start_codon:yes stop_codon:yes gene_type:complete
MVGYGAISKEQVPSGTITTVVGLGLASTGLALMEAPAQVAIGLPTLGAGVILLYKGLLKEGVLV